MPAPVPIQFVSPMGETGSLAIAAGMALRRQRDRQRRQELDMQFLNAEADRQAQHQAMAAQFAQESQMQQQAIDASRPAFVPRDAFALQNAMAMQRRMAPAPQTIGAPAPAMLRPRGSGKGVVSGPGGTTTLRNGRMTIEAPSPPVFQGGSPGAAEMASNLPTTAPRTRFTQVAPDVDPLTRLIDSAPIDPREAGFFKELAASGAMDPAEIATRLERLTRPGNQEGLTVRDRQQKIAALQQRKLSFNEYNDPDRTARNEIERLIQEHYTAMSGPQRTPVSTGTPQLSGRSLASDGGPKPLTLEVAQEFMRRAGGNRAQAEQMAREAGYYEAPE